MYNNSKTNQNRQGDKCMKLMIASDIHGSAFYLKKLIERYNEEKPERILLLGDLLYHGPRNDLPKGYEPKEVIELLNNLKNEIWCVRGNCDAEVDQMVLKFPIMSDTMMLFVDGHTIFATHGHLYNEERLPLIKKGDILLHGHSHVQALKVTEDYVYINPGSVSIPKEGNKNSYILYENNTFTIKSLDGEQIAQLML